MKKLFTGLLLAAVTLFSVSASADHYHPRWGYFYNNSDEVVASGAAVNWSQGGSTESDGVFNGSDTHNIVIEHPGTYLVTYILTLRGDTSLDTNTQFALFVNNSASPVLGSIYSTSDIGNGLTEGGETFVDQLVGQAIVHITSRDSTIQLRNHSEFDVALVNDAGTSDTATWGNNVSASLLLHRIDPHN